MIERLWEGAAIVVVGKTDLDDLEKRLEAAENKLAEVEAWLSGKAWAPQWAQEVAHAARAEEERP